MPVKTWHVGKLVLLWVWGLVAVGLSVQFLRSVENPLLGFFLIAVIVGSPVVLSVITWKWLGGKEP